MGQKYLCFINGALCQASGNKSMLTSPKTLSSIRSWPNPEEGDFKQYISILKLTQLNK